MNDMNGMTETNVENAASDDPSSKDSGVHSERTNAFQPPFFWFFRHVLDEPSVSVLRPVCNQCDVRGYHRADEVVQ